MGDRGEHLSVSQAKLADKCSLAMAEVQASWMAAILDAEGSVSMYQIWRMSCGKKKPGWIVRIQVKNTDLRLLLAVSKICGGKINGPYSNPTDSARAKPRYDWSGAANVCRQVLPQIRPYLVCKGAIVDLALEALQLKADYVPITWSGVNGAAQLSEYQQKLASIAAAIKRLNQRGVVV